jgi:hypothetical protein
MTPPQPNDEALLQVLQWHRAEVEAAISAALDRIATSVKQHTVPEGKHLVTRSYVLNTIEFERYRAQSQLTGDKS